jgi:transposase
VICGVDISSSRLDASIGPSGAFQSFAHSPAGLAGLLVFLKEHEVDLVAMEATGGYEQPVLAMLSGAGLPAAVLNPREVRQFAQSMGRLEKTDRIDAGMIAHFAQVRGVRPVAAAPAGQGELRALVTRLGQLTVTRVAQRHQLRQASDAVVRRMIGELLALVDRQIKQLSGAIAGLVGEDPLWSSLDGALRSIKGVADRTVALLLAELPELGQLSGKAVSKLAGLAPLASDSGVRRGQRHIRGGRAEVRQLLFIVASVVARCEPDFIEFQKRLKENGKPPKVVRIAVAHKLLLRLNARAREARALLTRQAA